ncbi:Uncharacterised protein [Mycobacteroides abscessus subsp. abscessus]|nr:Uncharacterised protein [Mycobacteroides abscessus subsp. abscessus]
MAVFGLSCFTAGNIVFHRHFVQLFRSFFNAFLHAAAVIFIRLCEVLDHSVLDALIARSKRFGQILDQLIALPILQAAIGMPCLSIVVRAVDRRAHGCCIISRLMRCRARFSHFLKTPEHGWLIVDMRIVPGFLRIADIHLATLLICADRRFWCIDRHFQVVGADAVALGIRI